MQQLACATRDRLTIQMRGSCIANSQRKFYYRSRPAYLINIFDRADRRRHIALTETAIAHLTRFHAI